MVSAPARAFDTKKGRPLDEIPLIGCPPVKYQYKEFGVTMLQDALVDHET